MRFHLVYSGSLRGSGNSRKPEEVCRIRRELSGQIKHLWQTHNALKVLAREGARKTGTAMVVAPQGIIPAPREMALNGHSLYEDLCYEIAIGEKRYLPLVRESLSLSCELKVLFLRQADPGALISQGGDIDNRIKLLLDALRMPDKDEQDRYPPEEDMLYCLMESDHLVSRLDVDTDRLLFPKTEKPDEVHLVIGVRLNVLQVAPHNMCLL